MKAFVKIPENITKGGIYMDNILLTPGVYPLKITDVTCKGFFNSPEIYLSVALSTLPDFATHFEFNKLVALNDPDTCGTSHHKEFNDFCDICGVGGDSWSETRFLGVILNAHIGIKFDELSSQYKNCIEKLEPYGDIPSGRYDFTITDIEVKKTRFGDTYLKIEFTIDWPNNKGTKVYKDFFLRSTNQGKEEAGRLMLKALTLACGFDSKLHDIALLCGLKVSGFITKDGYIKDFKKV